MSDSDGISAIYKNRVDDPCVRCGAELKEHDALSWDSAGAQPRRRHKDCPDSHQRAARLYDAARALREAGAEKLPGRLEVAFARSDSGAWAEQHTVLRQARSWATGVYDPGRTNQLATRTLNAIGLLWAWLEMETTDADR